VQTHSQSRKALYIGLTATVTGTVNTTAVGSTVNVTDQTAPVIALMGANSITIQAGIPYMDPGSIVTDNVDTGLPNL